MVVATAAGQCLFRRAARHACGGSAEEVTMRIAVTGREGQVARCMIDIGPAMGVEIVAVGRPELDLADPASVHAALAAARPDAIVSAAAYTAVDKAETEAELAFAVNGVGAGAVAQAAASLGVPV